MATEWDPSKVVVPQGWKLCEGTSTRRWDLYTFNADPHDVSLAVVQFYLPARPHRRGLGYYVSSNWEVPEEKEIGPFETLAEACRLAEVYNLLREVPLGWDKHETS